MIISFSGKKGAGKTLSADYVSNLYGFRKVSFAAPLKELCSVLEKYLEKGVETAFNPIENWCIKYSIPTALLNRLEAAYDYMFFNRDIFLKKDQTDKPRTMYQYIGTDICRSYWVDIWINLLSREIDYNLNYVIDDLRFNNELRIVDKSFYIVRPDYDSVDCHISENTLDVTKIGDIIINDSDKVSLYRKIGERL